MDSLMSILAIARIMAVLIEYMTISRCSYYDYYPYLKNLFVGPFLDAGILGPLFYF